MMSLSNRHILRDFFLLDTRAQTHTHKHTIISISSKSIKRAVFLTTVNTSQWVNLILGITPITAIYTIGNVFSDKISENHLQMSNSIS